MPQNVVSAPTVLVAVSCGPATVLVTEGPGEQLDADECGLTTPTLPHLAVPERRVGLCFLTSTARAAAPSLCCRMPLWSDACWQRLADDFEQRTGCLLEAAFCLLRHDDSSGTSEGEFDGFLSRAAAVPPVPTQRASLSLVLAELQLVRAALDAGCETLLILSGSCLPLVRLDQLHRALLAAERSVLQYHFMRGGQQRLLRVPYGSLQWKVWHRREAQVLAALSLPELEQRWGPLEAMMQRYHLAPDEVVLVNELHERAGPLDLRCERRPVTYTEWEAHGGSRGPPHARTFTRIPEAAWEARARGVLLCRKVLLQEEAEVHGWWQRLCEGD